MAVRVRLLVRERIAAALLRFLLEPSLLLLPTMIHVRSTYNNLKTTENNHDVSQRTNRSRSRVLPRRIEALGDGRVFAPLYVGGKQVGERGRPDRHVCQNLFSQAQRLAQPSVRCACHPLQPLAVSWKSPMVAECIRRRSSAVPRER